MPTITLPKFELPEGLRDMTAEDIGKAMPDVHLPRIDVDALGKRAGKVIDDVAASVSSNVEKALPSRPAPSPVPFAILGMLGGLIVGWLLATSPTTAPRIQGFLDWLRARVEDWRAGRTSDLGDDLDEAVDELRSDSSGLPVMAEPEYAGTASATMHSGTGYADEQPWSDQPDLRGQSLGAAAADDYRTRPSESDDVAEEVIVVDAAGTAQVDTGTGRLTDQMQIDDTEGDETREADPPVSDEPLGGGRLTDTMRIDDSDDSDELRPAPPDRF